MAALDQSFSQDKRLHTTAIKHTRLWGARCSDFFKERAFFWSVLSEEEQTRAMRFVRSTDQERAIVHFGLRRALLAEYVHTPPETLSILYAPRGKPYLKDFPWHFSISHSDDYWVLILDQNPIGVDIEYKKPGFDFMSIAERFFAASEVTALQKTAAPETLFWHLWTAKEALLKALGEGLGYGLEKLALRWNDTTNHLELSPTMQQTPFHAWEIKPYAFWPEVALTAAIMVL